MKKETVEDNTINTLIRIYNEIDKKDRFVHPELKEGEVLLMNVTPKELEMGLWGNPPDFIESFRVGDVAYVTNGSEVVPDWKPLFGRLKTKKK